LNPKHHKVSDYLATERRSLEKAIYQKELELSQLARCRYITRPKPEGKPHHAKVGNINYAIFSGETSGDFILTLDADHIPKPNFLQRVLPYFYNYNLQIGKYESNQIAFVQTPQSFYNIPSCDPFGHQASLFYGPIQQGKDGMTSALYTGTNAVLRREALISNRLTFVAGSWCISAREIWCSEQYAIALFPLFIQSVLSVFAGRFIKFQVTPKQRKSGIHIQLVWPQLMIFLLTILGMLWCFYRFTIGGLGNP
jgi:cellulose synthase (UDP-forming)